MAERICITGIGVVSAIGVGKEAFLRSLRQGISGIREIETFDTGFSRSRKGGIVSSFNPKDFVEPGKIRRLDRASQFATAASRMALSDAEFDVTPENAHRIGIVVGSGFCGLSCSEAFHRSQVLKGFLDLNPMIFPNTVPNAPASHVSIELGIQGVNCTLVQSFCTAEAAIVFACDQLRAGRAEILLAGGVDDLSAPLFRGFSDLRLLATDRGEGEESRPYDQRRNGIVLGEGSGILTLERAEDARLRGVRIYGYILDYNLIGKSPRGGGVEDLIRSVKAVCSGMENRSLDYISGAGNSSREVDALEALGVKAVFPEQYPGLPVTSIKSMTGEAIASGGLRMVADVLSLENQFIPPTANYAVPDPVCDLSYVVGEASKRKIETLLHLGISPDSCFSSILVGAPWSS